ncbi:alpha/beta hydrolase family protein [Streptomyces sp. PanSC19]|uniref:alpha/beta hydrolase n=1 Tax=Streptomyces sp. PanSC19 TaxID=1520455 RepID=UPI000FA4BD07|nr:alpha/beta hydrolase [Streptomyces sp. PanSC19]ROQ35890.1 alpha/beta hydrolase family protein [Streptomyces sp. PanSC19]
MFRTAARHRALVLALAVLGTTSLAACTAGSGQDGSRPGSTAAADPAARPDLRRFYGQRLDWRPCGDFRCATLTVPRDYDRPGDGETFALPVAKAATAVPGKRLGSLVLNPGGPGEPGVRLLKDGVADDIGKGVRERFDIVSFDPRGVGGSKPALTCLTDDRAEDEAREAQDAHEAHEVPLYPRTDAERADALADARATAAACRKASGPLLPHVGTDDAARDMDVLRAALGERRLTYVGWSYGTSLGTSYAEQFPRRVRAMVLDGAVDPSLDWRQRVLNQSAGFRDAVEEYADSCADVVGEACPGTTPGEIRALVDRLLDRTRREPLPVDGSEEGLDAAGLVSALSLSMYTPEAQWEGLSEALRAADGGDGTKLAALAAGDEETPDTDADTDADTDGDTTTDPDSDTGPAASEEPASDGPEDNSDAALMAVDCLDVPHPRDARAYWDALAPADRAAGVYGTSGVTSELVCADWPARTRRPHRVHAPGVPPVLVVGTAGDPATPYDEAVSLARQFPGGMLLSFEAPGHTGYGRDACVDEKVEEYLVSLTKVRPGTTCAP